MKKGIILVGLALICAVSLGKEIKTITLAEAATAGTWVNDLGYVATIESAFGTLGAAVTTNEIVTVTISEASVAYVVDSGTIASNKTVLAVDFDTAATIGVGETCTITRTVETTNSALNVMIVIE